MPYHNPEPTRFVSVPKVQPDRYADFPAFRETFLAQVIDPENNEALRAFGKVQFSFVLEAGGVWPFSYIDASAHDLRAVLADLRYLQGFLAFWSQYREKQDVKEEAEAVAKQHDALWELGGRLSKKIGALADDLEKEVGDWRFE